MRSFWQQDAREEAVARLERLAPDAPAAWGRFDAPRMVVHLTDALRMTFGDLPTQPRNFPLLRTFPLKQLVIYVLPFPRGAPTARELLERVPGDWASERRECRALIERFATERRDRDWPTHPAFGRLDAQGWGVLACRHVDHHLRQFGV
jgi:hypothetical protein